LRRPFRDPSQFFAFLPLDVAALPPKKVAMLRAWWPLALLLFMRPGVAFAQDAEGTRSLLSDVARIIAAEEADDWFTDREAWQSVEEHLLSSVCRATPDARDAALAQLRARHTALGDPKALFAQHGKLSTQVTKALTAEREFLSFERALQRQNECPFWLRPEPGFHGLQSDRRRLTISIESGGDVQFRRTRNHWTFGAGGGGRLLFGWGFDGRYTLLFGPQFGGSALLRPNSNASEFVINYFPAVPLVFRARQLTWHYELETAPVALFEADNTRLSYGVRVGGAFAFTALRRRNVLPWAGLAVAYEYYFEGGGREPIHFLRGGLRIGLPWDP
jgi:hypothetical protein